MCDVACKWKLDGEAKGTIAAGGSAKAPVEMGQHAVSGSTEDGADQIRQLVEIKQTGQTLLRVDLGPVRTARRQHEQQAREAAAHAERERVKLIWTEPAMHLV
jgi:hypothetical protein